MSRPGIAERVDVEALFARSVELIRANQSEGGGYIASPSLAQYRFVWLRDGAFVADAMSRIGEVESAEAFFGWCDRTIGARADHALELVARHRAGGEVTADEHLACRYRADGGEAALPWSTFQLDGYGAWLWALGEHARRHGRGARRFGRGAETSVRYLAEFWREPCFDWWEERWGRYTVTLAAVRAGLGHASGWEELDDEVRALAAEAAGEIDRIIRRDGVRSGRLVTQLGGDRLDASLVACAVPFGPFAPDDPVVVETVHALERDLAHGGVHRHADDSYYGGGEWLSLAALVGWWYAEVGRTDDAWAQLEWIAAQAAPAGDLPEQVADHLLVPEALAEWTARWGPSASPLLWSHAWFMVLALELGVEPPGR